MKLVISEEATSDMVEIYRYSFQKFGHQKAEDYLLTLNRNIESLLDNPELGVDLSSLGIRYRRIVSSSHGIYYRVTGEVISIVRILHHRRDVARYL